MDRTGFALQYPSPINLISSYSHDPSGAGPQDNLFQYIDRSNVIALNASEDGSKVIKPWHERLDEAVVRDGPSIGFCNYFHLSI
jgi:hypothetical protein